MSVTFSCASNTERTVNVANGNAIELLRWLGFAVDSEVDLYGSVAASELAARCRRRLWDEPRNHDPALPASITQAPGRPTVVCCGRDVGYLRRRTQDLLALVADAPEGALVHWN